jgi:hypothetical protein
MVSTACARAACQVCILYTFVYVSVTDTATVTVTDNLFSYSRFRSPCPILTVLSTSTSFRTRKVNLLICPKPHCHGDLHIVDSRRKSSIMHISLVSKNKQKTSK